MDIKIDKILDTLKNYYGPHEFNEKNKNDPFKTLVACILSLRTKDEVTNKASKRLFLEIKGIKNLSEMDEEKLAETIYPVGFYKTKAKRLIEMSQKIIRDYKGIVPDSIDELLKLKGVGRKTANLVVSLGYGKDGICVDTHVHRISNRFGYVKTKNPFETEMALRKKLPLKYWKLINFILVEHGQNVCAPISPKCSICPVSKYCRKVGVKTSR